MVAEFFYRLHWPKLIQGLWLKYVGAFWKIWACHCAKVYYTPPCHPTADNSSPGYIFIVCDESSHNPSLAAVSLWWPGVFSRLCQWYFQSLVAMYIFIFVRPRSHNHSLQFPSNADGGNLQLSREEFGSFLTWCCIWISYFGDFDVPPFKNSFLTKIWTKLCFQMRLVWDYEKSIGFSDTTIVCNGHSLHQHCCHHPAVVLSTGFNGA